METRGKILGEEVALLATCWVKERPHGGTFSMDHGIVMTKTGGKVMAKGSGISLPGHSLTLPFIFHPEDLKVL